MKAVIQSGYGSTDVLSIREVDTPEIGPGEILLQVHAASMHADVWHVMTGHPYALRLMGSGLRRPKNPIPGIDAAGIVAAVAPDVTDLAVGDRVFGEIVRGHQWKNGGAFAEFAAVPAAALATVPEALTLTEAAAVPTSALIALRSIRDEGGVDADQRVLIIGAGGGVGTFAVQIAKAFGAYVIAVDHGSKLEMLRGIGADEVIDYTAGDFTDREINCDLLLDIASQQPFAELRRTISPTGTYIIVGHDHFDLRSDRWIGGIGKVVGQLMMSPFVPQLPGLRRVTKTEDPFGVICDLVEAGRVVPVVDRTFPLDQVRQAMDYMTSGKTLGKVVISVRDPADQTSHPG